MIDLTKTPEPPVNPPEPETTDEEYAYLGECLVNAIMSEIDGNKMTRQEIITALPAATYRILRLMMPAKQVAMLFADLE